MRISDVMKWINETIKKYDKSLYFFILLSAISNSIFILSFSFLPKVLVGALTEEVNINRIILYIIALGSIIGITKFLYMFATDYCSVKYMRIRLNIISELGRKFMNIKFNTINSEKFVNKSQKADNAINGNQQGYECVLKRITILISNIMTFIVSLSVIVTLRPVLILPVLLVILISRWFNQKNKVIEKTIVDDMISDQRKSDYFFELMSDVNYGKEIRLYNFAPWLSAKLMTYLNSIRLKKTKIYSNNFKTKFIISILNFAKDVLIYLYLIYCVVNKNITIGDFLMFFSLAFAFSAALSSMMDDFIYLRYHSMFVNDIINFDNELNMIKEDKKIILDVDNLGKWTIRFDNVSFKYPDTDKYVLDHISFEIHKGEKLAVIGLNGSGKTTMIKLLTRLYDVTEGAILLNNVNIQDCDRSEYYKLFAPMFQDVFMFAFSLSENISMKQSEDVDYKLVEETIRKIHLTEKIHSLPKGVYTSCMKILDDEGVQFSGGEEQKILLARTLYKGSQIIILDEPTASMDPISEDRLYNEFNDIINDKTAIFITHRLASTRFCDTIYVFKNGHIVENGNHDELIAKTGEYHRLFTMQAKYYQR